MSGGASAALGASNEEPGATPGGRTCVTLGPAIALGSATADTARFAVVSCNGARPHRCCRRSSGLSRMADAARALSDRPCQVALRAEAPSLQSSRSRRPLPGVRNILRSEPSKGRRLWLRHVWRPCRTSPTATGSRVVRPEDTDELGPEGGGPAASCCTGKWLHLGLSSTISRFRRGVEF